MARLPLTLPPDAGENVTLKVTLWPALKVTGKLKPLAANPEPVVVAAEIVTLVPPELVRVSASVWELPTGTLPKPRLGGFAVSWPEVTPVPNTGKVTAVELLAVAPLCPLPLELSVMNAIATLPLSVPADCGVNVTLQVTLCPPARVTG
jgi:hypothetical protein